MFQKHYEQQISANLDAIRHDLGVDWDAPLQVILAEIRRQREAVETLKRHATNCFGCMVRGMCDILEKVALQEPIRNVPK